MKFSATRLAPSPTGALHLGHAHTFLVTWWLARQAGAKIYMRMEDLDAGRAKPESVQQAYDDLKWLGMDWDAWESNSEFRILNLEVEDGVVMQSRRVAAYSRVLDELWQKDAVYPCTCSRAEIAAAVASSGNAPHEGEGMVRYPGTCAGERYANFGSKSVREVGRLVREKTGKPVCWRFCVREGPVTFEDAIAGRQTFDVAAEAGDFPVTRFAEGDTIPPAYQLACVVDDHAMGIDCVIRGDDLLSSTPRQMLIYEALGWRVPVFGHVPLVIGPDGKRLAKRHGESRIAQFSETGIRPERIVGWAAWRSGQLEKPREISASEILLEWDVRKLPVERIILGPADFEWLRRGG